ncbi:efflux RND transporter periplasmic adaptor subunit [Devosia sp.]|uniref:efflux RND transporter periplasmic adaptor subunit n=1 Tax=Devosia sp. TaxID=1871048 RepID=UPI002EFDEFE1
MRPRPRPIARLAVVALALAGLSACQQPDMAAEEQPRLVRVVTVSSSDHAATASLTGEVQARTKIDLAFRITGQISEIAVAVGDHVTAGQVLARIDAEAQRADLELAEASVEAADAALEQAAAALARQQALLASGLVTRSKYDQAEQDRRTAESSLESARAMRQAALNALSYTELRADSDGIVTRVNRDAGEVAPSAQPVVSVAHDGPRDAVFNVHETLLFAGADELQAAAVDVALVADANVRATGRIREVSPTVDPKTGTVRVRVTLQDAPAAMTLGSLVTGHVTMPAAPATVIPWSAITLDGGQPAVWLVAPEAHTASIRPVEIAQYTTEGIILAGGLQAGDLLVVEGGQFLYPGKPVRLAGGDPS